MNKGNGDIGKPDDNDPGAIILNFPANTAQKVSYGIGVENVKVIYRIVNKSLDNGFYVTVGNIDSGSWQLGGGEWVDVVKKLGKLTLETPSQAGSVNLSIKFLAVVP